MYAHTHNYQITTGFHDEDNFGILKKGRYHPASDFNFDLIAEVICSVPASSGYFVHLTPCQSSNTRYSNLW